MYVACVPAADRLEKKTDGACGSMPPPPTLTLEPPRKTPKRKRNRVGNYLVVCTNTIKYPPKRNLKPFFFLLVGVFGMHDFAPINPSRQISQKKKKQKQNLKI
jgi:hypothetical protein